jgi:hypothetical protein
MNDATSLIFGYVCHLYFLRENVSESVLFFGDIMT